MKKFIISKKSLFKQVTRPFGEDKAQSEAVFRLMIDGIVGMAILLIIISSLSYFQELRVQASNAKFFSLVESSINSPNGNVFVEKKLSFVKGGSFSAVKLQREYNIPLKCFDFETNLSYAKIIGQDSGTGAGKGIEFTQSVETNVYAKCELSNNSCDVDATDCCELNCVFSFGKKLK